MAIPLTHTNVLNPLYRCRYITVDSATTASQNEFFLDKLSLHQKSCETISLLAHKCGHISYIRKHRFGMRGRCKIHRYVAAPRALQLRVYHIFMQMFLSWPFRRRGRSRRRLLCHIGKCVRPRPRHTKESGRLRRTSPRPSARPPAGRFKTSATAVHSIPRTLLWKGSKNGYQENEKLCFKTILSFTANYFWANIRALSAQVPDLQKERSEGES